MALALILCIATGVDDGITTDLLELAIDVCVLEIEFCPTEVELELELSIDVVTLTVLGKAEELVSVLAMTEEDEMDIEEVKTSDGVVDELLVLLFCSGAGGPGFAEFAAGGGTASLVRSGLGRSSLFLFLFPSFFCFTSPGRVSLLSLLPKSVCVPSA